MNFFISAIAVVFVFGLVILIHEAGHYFAAKYSGIKVNEFAFGMGPTIWKTQKGETVYAVRLLPIGGFVSMEGENEESDNSRSFTKAPIHNRALVMAAGAIMNLLLGFAVLFTLVCSQNAITSRTVSSFYEGATTQASGLQVGDTILAVNGRRCFIADDIIYEFARTQNGTANLTVQRGSEKIELENVVFDTTPLDGGGNQIIIDFTVLPVNKNIYTISKEAVGWTISIARLIFLSLVDLATGRVAINQLSGPVGIVTIIGEAASIGLQPILLILAMLTINLGVFNLMPLPALDGGRLVLLAVEAVRKKPLEQKYEIFINTAGFLALMLLMVFVTFNDITKLL